jgi:glycosyltransferase involved in cell wall biosynthesis
MTTPNKMKSARKNIIVLIPAYNEYRFIGSVVLQAKNYADTILVIDDGSSDSSGEIARKAGAKVITHTYNQGKAAAINTGFKYIKKNYRDRKMNPAIVLMDADCQHKCEEIPEISAPVLSGEADIVVGSRFLGAKSRIPRWRKLGQRALTLATNFSSGFRVTDSQSGFRAFSQRAVRLLDFESVGFSVESEMQFLAQSFNLHVVEIPIHAIYEEPPKRNPFNQAIRIIGGIIKLTGQYRPLLFFGLPGVFLVSLGIVWGVVVVERFNLTGHLAAGYAMICLLLSIVGVIMISTGFTLHSIRGLLVDLLRPKKHS